MTEPDLKVEQGFSKINSRLQRYGTLLEGKRTLTEMSVKRVNLRERSVMVRCNGVKHRKYLC